jgi:hypothetical protein
MSFRSHKQTSAAFEEADVEQHLRLKARPGNAGEVC